MPGVSTPWVCLRADARLRTGLAGTCATPVRAPVLSVTAPTSGSPGRRRRPLPVLRLLGVLRVQSPPQRPYAPAIEPLLGRGPGGSAGRTTLVSVGPGRERAGRL